jgi:hypothetical protein
MDWLICRVCCRLLSLFPMLDFDRSSPNSATLTKQTKKEGWQEGNPASGPIFGDFERGGVRRTSIPRFRYKTTLLVRGPLTPAAATIDSIALRLCAWLGWLRCRACISERLTTLSHPPVTDTVNTRHQNQTKPKTTTAMAQKPQGQQHLSVPDQLKLFAVELLEKVRVHVFSLVFGGG